MKITDTTIKKLAKMSGFRLTDAETESYMTELTAAVARFDRLSALDTSQVTVLRAAVDVSALRADVNTPSLDRAALLAAAPQKTDGAFLVPETIE